MHKKSYTKDERFLIKLYEEASKNPSLEDPLDHYAIGKLMGLEFRAVSAISKLFIRANFIKKYDDYIVLTSLGIKLAQELINA